MRRASATLGDASGKSRTPELEAMRTRIRSELLCAPLGGDGTNGNGGDAPEELSARLTESPEAPLPEDGRGLGSCFVVAYRRVDRRATTT